MAFKYTVAIRTLQRELRLGVEPTQPTPIITDAKAVTDGSHLERITRATRWLAAKYAMIRWGMACRAIVLARVASEDQVADIVTKPISGRAFYELRARVLGLLPGMRGGIIKGMDGSSELPGSIGAPNEQSY